MNDWFVLTRVNGEDQIILSEITRAQAQRLINSLNRIYGDGTAWMEQD